jgi:hypothetical protein
LYLKGRERLNRPRLFCCRILYHTNAKNEPPSRQVRQEKQPKKIAEIKTKGAHRNENPID